VAALAALGVDAGGVEPRAEIVELSVGVGQQVPTALWRSLVRQVIWLYIGLGCDRG
jgi:hypothetical protein